MHPSAHDNGRLFFDTYLSGPGPLTVVNIGAQDVNGSLRSLAPPGARYIGVDLNAMRVDIYDAHPAPKT